MTRTIGLAALALAAATLAGACSGPAKPQFFRPNPDEFRTGTCHDAANALLTVGDLGQRLAGADKLAPTDNAALTAAQRRLSGLRTSAELSQPVNDLVVAIGFVRLRADSRTYDPALIPPMVDAQQKVVRSCTG